MAAKNFLKATAALAGANVLVTIMGLAKTKVLAQFLAPAGMGIIGQITNFQLTIITLALMGTPHGVMRSVALYLSKKDYAGVYRVVRTAGSTVALLGAVLIAVQLLYARSLSSHVLGTRSFVDLMVLSTPWTVFGALVLCSEGILQGLGNIRAVAASRTRIAIGGLVVLVPLVIMFRLQGAVIGLALVPFFNYLMVNYQQNDTLRNLCGERPKVPLFEMATFRELVGIGVSVTIVSAVVMINQLVARRLLIDHFGATGYDNAGFFQAVWTLSSQYTNLLCMTMVAFSYPRLSAMQDHRAICKETNDNLRMAAYVIAPSACVLIAFSPIIIPLLYSGKFMPAVAMVPIKTMSDWFFILAFVLGLPLLPMGRLASYISVSVMHCTLSLVGMWLLLPRFGLLGAPISYTIALGLATLIWLIDQRRAIGLKLTDRTLPILLIASGCIVLSVLASYTHGYLLRTASALLPVTWVATNPGIRAHIMSLAKAKGHGAGSESEVAAEEREAARVE